MALNTIVVKVCMCIPFAGKSSLFFCELFKVASGVFFHIIGKNRTHRLRQQNPICCVAKKRNNNGEEPLRRAEEEEEKGEEKAAAEARADMERLKLGPTKLWTGLVLHHKDVFVSHVIPKLNGTDRFFFSKVNRESWSVLAYAGVELLLKLQWYVHECSSISTLEWAWNNTGWGEKSISGRVRDQAWFCWQVA